MVLKLMPSKHETIQTLQTKYNLDRNHASVLADKLHSDYEKFSEFERIRKNHSTNQIALAAKALGFI